MHGPPPHHLLVELHIRPPEQTDGPDPVTGLVRHDERQAEKRVDLIAHPEQRLVLRRRQHRPVRRPLLRKRHRLERLALEPPRPDAPVQDGPEELEVIGNDPVPHRPALRRPAAQVAPPAPLGDVPRDVPRGEIARPPRWPEDLEHQRCRAAIMGLRPTPLGRGHLTQAELPEGPLGSQTSPRGTASSDPPSYPVPARDLGRVARIQ